MGKAAAVLLALVGLTVLSWLDRDGRLLQGHLGGEVLGFRVQVDLRLTQGIRAAPNDAARVPTVEACVVPDSLWEVRSWR